MADSFASDSRDGLALADATLADKYDLDKPRVLMTGTQAIVRLLLMQKEADRRAGLNTAGFVTGYRGSPLGGVDAQMHRAKTYFDANDILFMPGLNEDLAATAIWGAQQAEMRGEGKYDGVFSLWYGKGPGVDRSGDVLRHVNLAGSSRFGGAVALMGDDHTAESSSTAHQSEFHFVDVMMPILSPAGVQEILDYGLYAFALSRYAGVWVGLKCLKDTVESTASVDGSHGRVKIVAPTDFPMPAGGLNIRRSDPVLVQEERLQESKRDATLAFIRANKLNKIITSGGPDARIGVITVGKSYLDVRQALDDLGIDEAKANDLGLRLYKVACPWPLEPEGLKEFARGLDLIIVVEEKRSLIEMQLRGELYGTPNQPLCIGKKDENGNWLFPAKGSLDANDVAIAIGRRLLKFHRSADLESRVARLERLQQKRVALAEVAVRVPHFCAGCPHSTSTHVPAGARAYTGIGCHYMAQWMDRSTEGYTHMGGEGANWVGEAPFSKRKHVFQNLGDGTYNHSGSLAIRFAVATNTNITFKILFNGVVAMTGGQKHEGELTVEAIAHQVAAEGVRKIALVTDEPGKYPVLTPWPPGLKIHHRNVLNEVQRDLGETEGVTVLIYDQTCAAEKRRLRKRGKYPDPDSRIIINELVCEGCGDCGTASNCVAVQPVETEFGRKRRIDQSACNKDFSCLEGFCPSFVTVHGAHMKKAALPSRSDAENQPRLPEPVPPQIGVTPYGILIAGLGGTGVVTISALLGLAAHLEGKGVGVIDMAGLAQKGGAVYCHVKIGRTPDSVHAIRIAAGEADLMLGCDLVVAGARLVLSAIDPQRTAVVVNSAEVFPGDIERNPDFVLPSREIKKAISDVSGERTDFLNLTALALTLLGDSIAANIFMLGYAWQKGYLPLSDASILRAIELNGESVEMNQQAFLWGRRAAHDFASVEAVASSLRSPSEARRKSQTLEEIVERRAAFLIEYQNLAYSQRYRARVAQVAAAEAARTPGSTELTEAAARYLFKVMAAKDYYEVARLFTNGSFERQLSETFEGDLTLEFHVAPPLPSLQPKNDFGGSRKMTFGPWAFSVLRLLARMKPLRGTWLDIFRFDHDRIAERKILADYEVLLDEILDRLTPQNHAVAVALARIPEKIRGFGHIKARHIAAAQIEEERLLAQFRAPPEQAKAAAE
ncbi:indolepyruvate ferredoxin oxidoreductase family protein [Methylocystis heyeri]|uniref:Indolepyruvate ferredoxin oxidoreductase family protein n=1 Tax=Methylocystis heyeri TaxID=391905 RepID=A0A6B8KA43_9HYPH|nr:indolepyruvate ferredoxin oxidoreductase family protein [Methylocystis heyeri]QGM44597.1 indolepyruvate ferredoxin oxidoreductase family protein [Methylocystis heyeri]